VSETPNGIPISTLSYEQLQASRQWIAGWVYPRRHLSPFIPLFTRAQRAALNTYGWLAVALAVAGVVLPFVLGSWWWLLLIAAGYVVWKANRQSMEQFFLENLQTNPAFFAAVRETALGSMVKVVLR
jgi:hypothetical protein